MLNFADLTILFNNDNVMGLRKSGTCDLRIPLRAILTENDSKGDENPEI